MGKQEGWRAKISEHWDRNDRQELGSPEYGAGGLSHVEPRLLSILSSDGAEGLRSRVWKKEKLYFLPQNTK